VHLDHIPYVICGNVTYFHTKFYVDDFSRLASVGLKVLPHFMKIGHLFWELKEGHTDTHRQYGDHVSIFISFEKGKKNKAFRKASGFQLTFVRDRVSSRFFGAHW